MEFITLLVNCMNRVHQENNTVFKQLISWDLKNVMCSRFLCSTAEPTISLRFFGKTQSQKQVEFHFFINIILGYTYCSVIVKFSSSF